MTAGRSREGAHLVGFAEDVRGCDAFVGIDGRSTVRSHHVGGFVTRGEGGVVVADLAPAAVATALRPLAARRSRIDEMVGVAQVWSDAGQGPGPASEAGALGLLDGAVGAARAVAADAELSISYSGERRRTATFPMGCPPIVDEQIHHLLAIRVVLAHESGPLVGYRRIGSRAREAWSGDEVEVRQAAEEAAAMACRQVGAPSLTLEGRPIVLARGAAGVFVHEVCGHLLEADVAREPSAVLGQLMGVRVCQVDLDVIDDPTWPGGWGTYGVDDLGCAGRPIRVIEEGTISGFIEGRGRSRGATFAHPLLTRMSNIHIAPGPVDPTELIEAVADGVLVTRLGGGEVLPDGTFLLGVAEMSRIERGRVTAPLRPGLISGQALAALAGIAGVGNDLAMGSPASCGKQGQYVPVGDGSPTLLVNNLTLCP